MRRRRIRGWRSTASSAAATTRAPRARPTTADVRTTHPNHVTPLPCRHTVRPLADWESDVNPLAADTKLRMELLSVGPFCMINSNDPEMGEDDQPVLDHRGNTVYKQIPHYCSPNATRTQRSGVTDVEYMIRPDREYWPVCFDSNHTRTCTHACASSSLGPAQRVQVCAAAARRRGGRRHRAVPRQPDGARCASATSTATRAAPIAPARPCARSPRSPSARSRCPSWACCRRSTRATLGRTSASMGRRAPQQSARQPHLQLGGEVPHARAEQRQQSHGAA